MEEKKNNSTKGAAKWKEVLVGGVSGIALGAAGTLFASSVPLDASAETADAESTETEGETANATAQMATTVNDSMSFTDAFNAARAEVGAGGVLNGTVTFTVLSQQMSGTTWTMLQEMSSQNQFIGMDLHTSMSHQTTAILIILLTLLTQKMLPIQTRRMAPTPPTLTIQEKMTRIHLRLR